MICIWVPKNSIHHFVEVCKCIHITDTFDLEFYTYKPHAHTKYLQLFIDYDEYVQLTEKNTFKLN